MKIAVIGAGVSGLAAARELHRGGFAVTVFEKAARVGGRCSTRPLGDFVFDTGASSIAPRRFALEKVMLETLPQEGLVRVELPVYTLKGMRIEPGDPSRMAISRYTYVQGNAELPRRLAEGLDVRLNVRIESLERDGAGYRVLDEPFDLVIVTLPVPQAVPLLATVSDPRPLGHISYRMCLSVLLGFAEGFPDGMYHALIEPEQRHPLTWMSLESRKCRGRAPEGQTAIVAQLSPEFSRRRFEAEDADIVEETVNYLRQLAPKLGNPVVQAVKRWRYSQPEAVGMFESTNQAGSKLIVAGDGLRGGRVEYAFETGIQAAALAVEALAR